MLDSGKYATIAEMAAGEKLDRGDLGRLQQLTLLAPEPKATPGGRYIVQAIVGGRRRRARHCHGASATVMLNGPVGAHARRL
ncbi:hypothetical protein [Elioraea tepidiphila]|uniref:hypothetical protein n=1 Tax=Elioraea tepidiphila TaxID=457934 RepID=UPI002FD94C66